MNPFNADFIYLCTYKRNLFVDNTFLGKVSKIKIVIATSEKDAIRKLHEHYNKKTEGRVYYVATDIAIDKAIQ